MSCIKGIPRDAKIPPLQRLIAHHEVDPVTECWRWTGYLNNKGYGVTGGEGKKTILAHRFAWEIMVGEIPEGMDLLHYCDNPPCINPAHLFPGNALDNIRDMIAKGRQVILRGNQVGTSKLTEDQVREIKSRLAPRNSGQLAREFGVSDSMIDNIRHGRSWRHVK